MDFAAAVQRQRVFIQFGATRPLEFRRAQLQKLRDALDDALALLRDRPTPLALYLFTQDRPTQSRVLAETRSGGVCLNDTVTHMIGCHLPFGGLGESGLGAYHGRASFDCFTHRRSVLRRSLAFDPGLLFPPPRLSLANLKRAFRFLLGG
jgi:aldehyde dehydrogenase (NAD+)